MRFNGIPEIGMSSQITRGYVIAMYLGDRTDVWAAHCSQAGPELPPGTTLRP